LRKKKITHLLVTGTMTNICCETTARSAMMRDFRVIFCSDLTFCNDNKLHSATLRNIKSHFGKVMHSSKIIFP